MSLEEQMAATEETVAALKERRQAKALAPHHIPTGRDLTLYRTVRFKERIQCSGRSEFTGPRESANILLY